MSTPGVTLPLLLALSLARAALAYSPPAPEGCLRDDTKELMPPGAEWTGPQCTRVTCEAGGAMSAVVCPLVRFAPNCRMEDGDPTAPFPDCCPQVRCPPEPGQCYRDDTGEWVADGAEWTGEGCTRIMCRNGSYAALPCGLLALPPDSSCRLEDGDPEAPYPACCPQINCTACWAEELGRAVEVGEKWTLAQCSGQATCQGSGAAAAVGCPLMAVAPGSPCSLNDGDPTSDDYPRCCPRITCPTCYSKSRREYFGPDETWTEPGCLQEKCVLSEDGTKATLEGKICASLQGAPNDADCTLTEPTDGEFPACCPVYTCKNYCFSESVGKFFRVGETWTEDSCTRAKCEQAPNGMAFVAQLPCPPPPPGPVGGCYPAAVNASTEYPDCCPRMECDELSCYSESQERRYQPGDTWTEGHCTQVSCQLDDDGQGVQLVALPCPLIATAPGCELDDGDASAEFPDCCPQVKCY